MLLGLFYLGSPDRGTGAIVVLAFENGRRVGRDQLVAFQDELLVKAVAGGLVNGLAAEVTLQFVFVIVVAAERPGFAVGRELFLFVENHELGCVSRLTCLVNV